MPIAVRCTCGRSFKVADEFAGKRGKCPGCGSKLVIPAAASQPPAAAPGKEAAASSLSDAGFDGVADLLNEDWGAPQPAAALSPWTQPSAATQPKKKKKTSGSSLGLPTRLSERAVSLLVIGVLIGLTVGMIWAGRAAWGRFRFYQALGGDDMEAALAEIAADLPHTVAYANEASVDQDVGKRKRLRVISHVLPSLPEGTDLSPLLELDSSSAPYTAAFELLGARAKREWIIEQSCAASERTRHFSAELLRPSFPFGRLDDASFAQLAEQTTPEEKQQRYDQLYAAMHRPYEQKLAGIYHVEFDAVWQATANSMEAKQSLTSPRLVVACQDYKWSIEFYGQTWKGKIDDLPQVSLSFPAKDAAADLNLLPQYQELDQSKLRLVFQEEAWLARIEPYPVYVPASSGSVALPRNQANQPGGGMAGVPAGATTKFVTLYDDGVKVSQRIEWTLPERPGYSKLELRLLRAKVQ